MRDSTAQIRLSLKTAVFFLSLFSFSSSYAFNETFPVTALKQDDNREKTYFKYSGRTSKIRPGDILFLSIDGDDIARIEVVKSSAAKDIFSATLMEAVDEAEIDVDETYDAKILSRGPYDAALEAASHKAELAEPGTENVAEVEVSNRMRKNRFGLDLTLLPGEPVLTIWGGVFSWNINDMIRVSSFGGGSNALVVGTTSTGVGVKFMMPGWSLTPVAGFDVTYTRFSAGLSLVTGGTVASASASANIFSYTVPLGVDWTSEGGFHAALLVPIGYVGSSDALEITGQTTQKNKSNYFGFAGVSLQLGFFFGGPDVETKHRKHKKTED